MAKVQPPAKHRFAFAAWTRACRRWTSWKPWSTRSAREKARHRSNVLLKRGIRAWRKGDIVKAGQWALKATEADADNSKAFHVLAMALERMGHLHKALVTYERAFELDPEDPELLINLGLTAWNLKLTEGAAKMFQLYIAACPDSPLGYNNLGSVQCDLGQPDIAIETLQRRASTACRDEAILWNSLATVLAEEGRADESLVFYNEAARLEPDFARAYHNLGYAYQHLGQLEEALEAYDMALERVVDPSERMRDPPFAQHLPDRRRQAGRRLPRI